MNFGDFKTRIRQQLWPELEQENLIPAHDQYFVEALLKLQESVPCYRYGNTDVFPQCSTYFNCGRTVLPVPRGRINSVYTIGKNKSTNGIANGTLIGSSTAEGFLLQLVGGSLVTIPTLADVATIETDGIYTVNVSQVSPSYSLYPANSPQYFRTEITYTDTNGNLQTIQPADLIHINVGSKNGFAVINAKAGTTISTTITPFNSPPADGKIDVVISVVAGSTASASDDDWCAKVFYRQVDYCHIANYTNACTQCNSGIFAVANALVANIFGCRRTKGRYPVPTDIGFELLPSLPQGYHYPQTSTNAGYRSYEGVYAIHRGRLYLAPWVESTESVVVEWEGTKTNWSDTDLVDDDPKFMEAVRLWVGIQHYTYYEDNPTRLADFKRLFHGGGPGEVGALRELISACRERTRVRSQCNELGGTSGSAATGVGVIAGNNGAGTSLYYNEFQSYTANCPSGQTGSSVTSVVQAGQVSSSISVADANARALSAAQADAQSKLSCAGGSGVFLNTSQSFTASCPAASGTTPAAQGTSATVTIPAGQYQSTVSQELADAAALAAATAQAQAQITCTFYNSPQTTSAFCPEGGGEQTATVESGQYNSTISQADADAKAKAQAQALATAKVTGCAGAPFQIGNTTQQVVLQGTRPVAGCSQLFTYNAMGIAPAGTFVAKTTTGTQSIVQLQLNQQAQSYAQAQAQAILNQQLAQFYATSCHNGSPIGFGGQIL